MIHIGNNMNNYYVFTNFVPDSEFTDADFFSEKEVMQYGELPFGSKLKLWTPIKIIIKNDTLTDYFECGPAIIVSSKLFEILNKYSCKGSIEFLPIELLHGSEKLTNYGILNFTEEVDVLDKEKSDICYDDGYPEIESIVIDEYKFGNRDICFIEDSNDAIVVTEKVKNEIDEANILGLNLENPEDWTSF